MDRRGDTASNQGPRPRRGKSRRGILATLARIFHRMAWLGMAMRLPSRGLQILGPMDDEEAELTARNDIGLPEADLTEEQRAEAIRRIKRKPRIG